MTDKKSKDLALKVIKRRAIPNQVEATSVFFNYKLNDNLTKEWTDLAESISKVKNNPTMTFKELYELNTKHTSNIEQLVNSNICQEISPPPSLKESSLDALSKKLASCGNTNSQVWRGGNGTNILLPNIHSHTFDVASITKQQVQERLELIQNIEEGLNKNNVRTLAIKQIKDEVKFIFRNYTVDFINILIEEVLNTSELYTFSTVFLESFIESGRKQKDIEGLDEIEDLLTTLYKDNIEPLHKSYPLATKVLNENIIDLF